MDQLHLSALLEVLEPDNSLTVMHASMPSTDVQLFFGPTSHEPLRTNGTNIALILFQLGLVPSISWCRKNGWWKDLSPGYQEIVFGSKRFKICILMPFEVTSEPS